MKALYLLLSLSFLVISPNVYALENIGFCHEYLNQNTHEVVPGLSVQLSDSQLLVRGELDPFHEQGMEDQTGWSLFERHLYRQYESAYWALFILKDGDKVYVLSSDKKSVLYEGYYKEFHMEHDMKWGDRIIKTYPNRPQLYSDPEFNTLLLDHQEFARLFKENHPAVAVIEKDPKTDYELYKYPMKLLWTFNDYPGRFTPVTEHFTYKREFGENLVEVQLVLVENRFYPHNLKYNPEEPTHVWEFQGLNGGDIWGLKFNKILGFDDEGKLLYTFESPDFGKRVMQEIKNLNAHRIFIVTK